MSNYSKWNAKQDPRTELHDVLGLTGAEVSINHLPAGAGVPCSARRRIPPSATPAFRSEKTLLESIPLPTQ